MSTRIQLRRDTAAQWSAVNPVLAVGEPAVESDTGKLKVGDGTSVWTSLPYILDMADLTPVIQELVAALVPPALSDEHLRDVIGATIQGDGDYITVDVDDVGDAVRILPGAAITEGLADLEAGLGTKVNSSTYVAGLAAKQDVATLADDMADHVGDGSAFDVAQSAAFTARQPAHELLGFYAALGNRHNAPCDILVLGDSFVEGQGATSNVNRWVDLFRDRIRERFPTPGVIGGTGFVGAAATVPSPAGQGFTVTGNTAGTFEGLGARGVILGPNGGGGVGTLTITRTCTSFDLHYIAPVSMTITIDGGAPTTITGQSGEQVWNSGPLTDGAHTIVVAQTGPNGWDLAYIEGAMFYRGDEAKGIRMWEAGRGGSLTGNFIAGGAFGTAWANSIYKASPDLVVITFGTNDAGAVPAAQFGSDLTALVALVRSKAADVPIALMPPFPRAGGFLAPWADYVAAAGAVADATANCVLLSVADRIPALSPDTYGLLSDGLHPNNKGHALMADVHLALLAPYGN